MAISATNKYWSTAGFGGTTLTSSSFTSVTGRLYFVAILNNISSTTPAPTSTNGITFTVVSSQSGVGGASGKLWLYSGVCTSGSSGTVSITKLSSETLGYSIDEIAGQKSSSPIIQFNQAAAKNTTLSSFASGSGTYAIGGCGGGFGLANEAGWTALATVSGSATMLTEFIATADTTPSWSSSFGGSSGIVAIEIGVDPPPAYTTTVVNSIMMLGTGI